MKLLTGLLVLGVLVAGLDLAVQVLAEQRASARVGAVLGTRADVDLQGVPVGLRLLTGRVPRARLTAANVPVEGADARLDRLEVTLTDVRLRWEDLGAQAGGLPPAGTARFVAVLDAATVQALLGVPRELLRVRLSAGVLRLEAAGFGVDADVRAQGGDVLVTPRLPVPALAEFGRLRIDLSGQPGAPAVDKAEVGDDRLLLRGRLVAVEGQA